MCCCWISAVCCRSDYIADRGKMIQSQLCHNCAPLYRKFINFMTCKCKYYNCFLFSATGLPFILTQLCQSNGYYAVTSMLLYRYNIYWLMTVSIGLLFTSYILNKPQMAFRLSQPLSIWSLMWMLFPQGNMSICIE